MGKGQANRQLIREAALKLIVERGYRQCTLTALSELTGLSKSQISYYYADLGVLPRELFKELVLEGQRVTTESMVFAESLEEQLKAVVEGALKWLTVNPARGKFFALIFHLTAVDKELELTYQKMVQAGRKRIETMLKPLYKRQSSPLAKQLYGLLTGHLIQMIALNEMDQVGRYRKEILSGFELILKEKT